jgi:hypothetical protein
LVVKRKRIKRQLSTRCSLLLLPRRHGSDSCRISSMISSNCPLGLEAKRIKLHSRRRFGHVLMNSTSRQRNKNMETLNVFGFSPTMTTPILMIPANRIAFCKSRRMLQVVIRQFHFLLYICDLKYEVLNPTPSLSTYLPTYLPTSHLSPLPYSHTYHRSWGRN